jgi:two-component system sensor histidine kinase EvgS
MRSQFLGTNPAYLLIIFGYFLVALYFFYIPDNGFFYLQSKALSSWLLGIILCLLIYLLGITLFALKARASYLCSIENFDRLTHTKLKAVEANQAKSHFLATISHEIRNPIQAILAIHELLLHDTALKKENKKLIQSANHASKSLLEILNQVLDISKIEAGKCQPSYAPTCLKDLINCVVTGFSGLAQTHYSQLQVCLDPSLAPSLMIDRQRFRQILQNLISNAIKFTPHGSIRVSCFVLSDTYAEQLLEIHIADTGCGMTQEEVSRVLRPYEQGKSNQATQFSGSGLGLTITNDLLTSLCSQLVLVSQENLGTTASFKLVCHRSSALVAPISERFNSKLQPPIFPLNSTIRYVLVVDDYSVCREVLVKQLQQIGCIASSACDGLEALEEIKRVDFDLVITDELMPNIRGSELASLIHEIKPDLPIIILTGNTHIEENLPSKSTDVALRLVKPIQLIPLKNAIEALPKSSSQSSWSMNSLIEFTGENSQSQIEVLTAIVTYQEEVLQELKTMQIQHFSDQYEQITHKILGGAKLINAKNLMRECYAVNTAPPHQFSIAISNLMRALQNNNQDINAYLQKIPQSLV